MNFVVIILAILLCQCDGFVGPAQPQTDAYNYRRRNVIVCGKEGDSGADCSNEVSYALLRGGGGGDGGGEEFGGGGQGSGGHHGGDGDGGSGSGGGHGQQRGSVGNLGQIDNLSKESSSSREQIAITLKDIISSSWEVVKVAFLGTICPMVKTTFLRIICPLVASGFIYFLIMFWLTGLGPRQLLLQGDNGFLVFKTTPYLAFILYSWWMINMYYAGVKKEAREEAWEDRKEAPEDRKEAREDRKEKWEDRKEKREELEHLRSLLKEKRELTMMRIMAGKEWDEIKEAQFQEIIGTIEEELEMLYPDHYATIKNWPSWATPP